MIPEAWEAGMAGRLDGWAVKAVGLRLEVEGLRKLAGWLAGGFRLEAGGLTHQRSRSEPLYMPLEPRFLRPGRLGGWEAGS